MSFFNTRRLYWDRKENSEPEAEPENYRKRRLPSNDSYWRRWRERNAKVTRDYEYYRSGYIIDTDGRKLPNLIKRYKITSTEYRNSLEEMDKAFKVISRAVRRDTYGKHMKDLIAAKKELKLLSEELSAIRDDLIIDIFERLSTAEKTLLPTLQSAVGTKETSVHNKLLHNWNVAVRKPVFGPLIIHYGKTADKFLKCYKKCLLIAKAVPGTKNPVSEFNLEIEKWVPLEWESFELERLKKRSATWVRGRKDVGDFKYGEALEEVDYLKKKATELREIRASNEVNWDGEWWKS